MKRSIISVTNDLSTDKRVNKTAIVLNNLGFEVTLVGRRLNGSKDITDRCYKTKRMRLLFTKGPLFYAEYNLRLFFYLLFHKADLLVSNDLDTLLSNYLTHKIKRSDLVYDTHEYFTGVPELASRKLVKNIWKTIEKTCLPSLDNIITVNDSIAQLYKKEYGKDLKVIRNISPDCSTEKKKSRDQLGLPIDKKIVILQGSGINIDRGAEEAVEAMQYVQGAILLIIGNGDVIPVLKEMINELYLQEKVIYIKSLPFDELYQYTVNSDLGLSLDKDTNINYKYSLPNKLFDYIHAGVPVLASPLVEIKKIIEGYHIGETIANHNPKHIASKINFMLSDAKSTEEWKKNLKIAASELCWENEEKKLIEIFRAYAEKAN